MKIDRIERIPEIVDRVFSATTPGRSGPAVVALSREILSGSAQVVDVSVSRVLPGWPGTTTMAELCELPANARRLLLVPDDGG